MSNLRHFGCCCTTPITCSRYPNTELYYCDICWLQLDADSRSKLVTESIKLACARALLDCNTIPKPKKPKKDKDGDGDKDDKKEDKGDNDEG